MKVRLGGRGELIAGLAAIMLIGGAGIAVALIAPRYLPVVGQPPLSRTTPQPTAGLVAGDSTKFDTQYSTPTPVSDTAAPNAAVVGATSKISGQTGGAASGAKPSSTDGALVFSVSEISVKISSYTKPFDISAADGTRLKPISNHYDEQCGVMLSQYNYPPALALKQPTMVSGPGGGEPRTCEVVALSTGENGRQYSGRLTVHILPAPDFAFTADAPYIRPALTLMELRIKPEPGYSENYPEVTTDPDYPLPCSGDSLGGEAPSWISSPGGDNEGNYSFTWHCHSEYILDPSLLPFPVHFIAKSRHYTHKLVVMVPVQGTKFKNW